ncbi:MAG: site-2 protease family protein [Chloroflexaceae bacterium]
MRSGIRIARIFGINIYINWSWLFIFLLLTWSLAAGFGQFNTEWSSALNWGIALLASLLFFASVLAHELAHSLVAKAQDIPVHNITLFLFGGVSNIQQNPRSPRAEFLMVGVGPLTSIGLGILFLIGFATTAGPQASALVTPRALFEQLSPLSTLLLWLGQINILLGLFNLIPGFPLDGGRVLRSILWGTTGDFLKGTRWAAIVGQAFAWLLILTGIAMAFGIQVPLLGSGVVGGIWLAFVGWFLSNAATRSLQQVQVEDILDGVTAERLMRADVPTVAPDTTVSDLVQNYIMAMDERAFPVMENDRMVGLVTMEDVREIESNDRDSFTVGEIMTPAEELVTVASQEEAADALRKLIQRDVRQVPVLRNGVFVGMVRRRDIIHWLQLHSSGGAAG